MTSTINAPSGSERALRWIGDLDHEFYDDERNRFVWYEASAIGFQVSILVSFFLVGAMLWIGSSDAIFYELALLFAKNLPTIIATSYAKKKYAEYVPQKGEVLGRPRNKLYVALFIFMAGGMVRVFLFDQPDAIATYGGTDSFSNGLVEGFLFGLPIAVLLAYIGIRVTRARNEREELLD